MSDIEQHKKLINDAMAEHSITVTKPENDKLATELAARFASLFMINYRRGDISGLHVSLTALTHALYALQLWDDRAFIAQQYQLYALQEGFPEAQFFAINWLVNHYFDWDNIDAEAVLIPWYQNLDDEWVLRKQLKQMFPDKTNSELSVLIAEQIQSK